MPFDAHQNLGVATVVIPPSPATTGTTLTVGAGEGARFPVAPDPVTGRGFNATVWPFDMAPSPVTAEIVRVTARTGDVLTITRAAEPPAPARAILAGDLIAETITAKALTDIESGTNFPQIATPGPVSSLDVIVARTLYLQNASAQPIVEAMQAGAGAQWIHLGNAANVLNFGLESNAGDVFGTVPNAAAQRADQSAGLSLMVIHAGGAIRFITGGFAVRGAMLPLGGFTWGGALTDPGAGRARFELGVSSLRGTVSATTGVATALFTAVSTGDVGLYLVSAGLGIGDAANWGAFATVSLDGAAARIVANNAALLTISLSGLVVQATQNSGGTQPIKWVAVKVA